jgi:predicted nucleic acid-binding protein
MVKKLVIDSSVAVKWTNSLNENLLDQADIIFDEVEAGKIQLFAPELLRYEVGNALLNKKLELPQSKASLTSLYAVPIHYIVETEKQAYETMEIAHTCNITYYDASFISLAQKYECPLVTNNPKHQKKYPGVKVIPLKEYK